MNRIMYKIHTVRNTIFTNVGKAPAAVVMTMMMMEVAVEPTATTITVGYTN